jgi:hypothetical protein
VQLDRWAAGLGGAENMVMVGRHPKVVLAAQGLEAVVASSRDHLAGQLEVVAPAEKVNIFEHAQGGVGVKGAEVGAFQEENRDAGLGQAGAELAEDAVHLQAVGSGAAQDGLHLGLDSGGNIEGYSRAGEQLRGGKWGDPVLSCAS